MEVDEMTPVRFERKVSEGGSFAHDIILFDKRAKKIYTTVENSKQKKTRDTISFPECTYDVLSMIYYARNINFSKYKIGDKIPLSIVIENKVYNLFIRYQGKEKIEHKNGDIYNTIKFSVMLVAGTIFSGGEEMTVWATDDQNHIPILIEAKILVGSIKVYLDEYSGLRWRMTSKTN
jgi:hypothetical protein